jgi:hypothetical protein
MPFKDSFSDEHQPTNYSSNKKLFTSTHSNINDGQCLYEGIYDGQCLYEGIAITEVERLSSH